MGKAQTNFRVQTKIRDADGRGFLAGFNVCYVSSDALSGVYNFFYSVDWVSADVDALMRSNAKGSTKNLMLKQFTEDAQKSIEDESRVRIRDSERTPFEIPHSIEIWKRRKKRVEKFSFTRLSHIKWMKRHCEGFIRGSEAQWGSIQKALDVAYEKGLRLVRDKLDTIESNAQNDRVRKDANRDKLVYGDAVEICHSVFSTRLGYIEGLDAPLKEKRHVYVAPFLYQFCKDRNGNPVGEHREGPASLLVSFGVEPYPYAVILMARIEPVMVRTIGQSYEQKLTKMVDETLHAIALVDGKFVVRELHVPYTLSEDKLEMAVLMAVGDSIPVGALNG